MDAPEPPTTESPKRRTWWLVIGMVIAGAIFTWLAFGIGIREKPPPDPTNGVELIPGRDRTAPKR